MRKSVEELWSAYRRLDPAAPEEPPTAFHFCDNREDADTCARLVAAGRKRATAASLAELEAAGDPLPGPGDLAVVTDWAGEAVAVIRTVRVTIVPFGEVTEDFARSEGEGDLSLAWWREAHRAYYIRVLEGTGHRFAEDMPIACETFEVVLTPAGAD
jgi:uncharacterized protein YhfF